MKQAFLIGAYKDPVQLSLLIDKLVEQGGTIFIYLDKKSSINPSEFIARYTANKKVFIVKNSAAIQWGGFSQLKSYIKLIEEGMNKCDAEYFHLISGQDFPLMSIEDLGKKIMEDGRPEYMSCTPLEKINWTNGGFSRLQFYHLNDWFNIRVRFWGRINSRFLWLQRGLNIKRKLPNYIQLWCGGSTWWTLSREALSFVQQFIEEHPDFVTRFKRTHATDEIFFQTIMMAGPFAKKITGDEMRYVDWKPRNGAVPAILDESDYEKIISSGKFFARKIETGISTSLMNKLYPRN